MIEFNANDLILVRLKEEGKKIYINYYGPQDCLEPSGYPKWNEPDEKGYVRFQFHELLKTFGPHIKLHIGGLPFDTRCYLIKPGEIH